MALAALVVIAVVHGGLFTSNHQAQLASLLLGLGGLASDELSDELSDGPSEERPVSEFPLPEGDLLVLCTDGILEARDGTGAFYPLAERMAAWRGEGPQSLIEHLHADLPTHVGGQLPDDAALVVVERGRNGSPAGKERR